MLFLFVTKHATLVRRSNITSLSLQLVFLVILLNALELDFKEVDLVVQFGPEFVRPRVRVSLDILRWVNVIKLFIYVIDIKPECMTIYGDRDI